MKTRFFVVALIAIFVGLGACGKSESKINTIDKFVVNGVEYRINNDNEEILHTYSKIGEGLWGDHEGGRRPDGWPMVSNMTTTIEITTTCNRARVTTDLNVRQNFQDGSARITVRAQNGNTKTYKVIADSEPFM